MLDKLVKNLNEWYRRPDNRNIRTEDYLALKNPKTGFEISRYYPRDYAPSDFSFFRFKDLLKDIFSDSYINYADEFYNGAVLESYYGYHYKLTRRQICELDSALCDYEYGTEEGAILGRPRAALNKSRESMEESKLNESKMENRATRIFEEILNESIKTL